MHSKIYHDQYIFINNKEHGFSSSPFIINKMSDNCIQLMMLWDLQFSMIVKNHSLIKLRLYSSKTSDKFKKKKILSFKFYVDLEDDRKYIRQKFKHFVVEFWAKPMEENNIYLSNPSIRIKKDFFDNLLK